MDLIWLFFILSTLQPVIKQRMLEASRARMIGVIERKRGSRVILLVHRQETMSLLGFPIMRYIDITTPRRDARRRADRPRGAARPHPAHAGWPGAGGDADRPRGPPPQGQGDGLRPALRDVGRDADRAGRRRDHHVQHAVLGPVDPQLGEYPAASLLKVVAEKPISEIDDKTLVLADVGKKAISQVRTGVEELLSRSMPAEKTRELAELLSTGT